MTVAGIIAEYNPFHAGHRYHIEETRRQTGADKIIVVMSGDFVQRGEPAILDKYLRARMALEGGADIVIEMPAIYATSSAEYFASAGVGILDQLGCVDYLSFGSEWANVEDLADLVDLLVEEPEEYRLILKENLEAGRNFPSAREAAIVSYLKDEKYRKIIASPNHILAIEYLKDLKRRKSKIQPCAIVRKGSGYHDDNWMEGYPSATAIRSLLKGNFMDPQNHEKLVSGIPNCFSDCMHHIRKKNFVQWDDMIPFLDYLILMEQSNLSDYFGIDHELAQRISRLYKPGQSFQDHIQICHSKNCTDAALRRAFLHLVLQYKKDSFLEKAVEIPIPYARILGFRKNAGKLISQMREESRIPIIQKVTGGEEILRDSGIPLELYQMDIKSANLYEQIAASKSHREYRTEYVRNPVIIP